MPRDNNPRRREPIEVNCPHCHSPIESVEDWTGDEVLCLSCGSSFRLDPDHTQDWSQDKLPKLDKFELLETLGRGAFGTVYRARDVQLDRIVAVKVPRSGQLLTNEDEDRFVREARNVAQLQHPGIVPVFEVGRGAMFPYIVCEYVEGMTLSDMLTGRKPSFRESAKIVAQASDALAHAHAQGVVHRDLKPSNIMLTPDGRPRVMDFGLAKRDAGEVTMTVDGEVLGTPAYMSPEQASGQSHHVDGRSDVYSLGGILYELLTGELPFRGNQRMLLHQVLHDEPRAPRSLNDSIPRDLETICLKAMAKEPSRRYQTAQALADDLHRFLSGQPITARPVRRAERAWRWCRRNPVVASLSAAVALVLVSGTIISTYFAADAIAQQRVANEKAAEALASAEQARDAQEQADQNSRRALASAESESQARAKADQEAERALTEAEKAIRVSQFLAGMFEASAPLRHGGIRFAGLGMRGPRIAQDPTKLTARELLDRGAQNVVEDLKDQPAVQAALLDTIGNVYIGLGLTEQAEPLITSALEIRRRLYPGPHLDTAVSLCSMAALRSMQLRWDDAADASRAAVTIRQELLGANHRDTIDAKFAVVFGMGWGTYDPEVEVLAREVVEWRVQNLGHDHPETAIAKFGLAGTLMKQKEDAANASPLVAQAMAALMKDPQTKPLGQSMGEIAQARILWAFGQYAASANLSTKAVEHFREFDTDDHPMFLYLAELHLSSLILAKRFDEAKEFCRGQIRRLQNDAAPTKDVLAHAVSDYLDIALRMNSPSDLDEVESLCRTELEKIGERHKPATIGEADLLETLARVLVAKGSKSDESKYVDEAEQCYRRCLSILQQCNRAPTFELALLMQDIAESVGRKDPPRALALYRETLGIGRDSILQKRKLKPSLMVDTSRFTKKVRPLDVDAFAQIVVAFGAMLNRYDKTAETETLYRESLGFTRGQKDPLATMRLTKELADLQQAQGNSADAERAYRECLQMAEGLDLPTPAEKGAWVSSIQLALGNCLLAQEKKVEAEEMYRGVLAGAGKDLKAAAQAKLSELAKDKKPE
jgi:serine/threonine protein kinase